MSDPKPKRRHFTLEEQLARAREKEAALKERLLDERTQLRNDIFAKHQRIDEINKLLGDIPATEAVQP